MDGERIAEFIEESKSSLVKIESDLLKLESSKNVDIDCVNRVFRAIDTITGSSGVLKIRGNIVSVSLHAESLHCGIHDGTHPPPLI